MNAKPIIDNRNYTVISAGVRYPNLTIEEAMQKARKLREEWRLLGFGSESRPGRPSDIVYWDGSLIARFATDGSAYQIELANKCAKGRAIGNEYVVTRRPDNMTCILARFDTREAAEGWIRAQ